MKQVVTVRGVRVGEGMPKVIVPIVGTDRSAILEATYEQGNVKKDLVEWRADCFCAVRDEAAVRQLLLELRDVLGDVPLLFTFRTEAEGGKTSLPAEAYEKLIRLAVDSACADLVDVELFSGCADRLIAYAHARNVPVIVSSHDFEKTPSEEEMIRRLCRMQELGADILKLAVMPKCTSDVLALLSATRKMSEELADRPLITMSMSGLGLISRIAGETFGSDATFGTVGEASAPGQMDAETLGRILCAVHDGMQRQENGK